MIIVSGPDVPEKEAGYQLRDLINTAWPSINQDTDSKVYILASVKTEDQPVKDLDLVVLVSLRKPITLLTGEGAKSKTSVQSLCLIIEVKRVLSAQVSRQGRFLYVTYRDGRPEEIQERSHRQKSALLNHLRSRFSEVPNIINLIWFTNISQDDELFRGFDNVLGGNSSWWDFLERVYLTDRTRRNTTLRAYWNEKYSLDPIIDYYNKDIKASNLNRLAIDEITKKIDGLTLYNEIIGKKMITFTGRGGTGKTVKLLRLAYQLYERDDAKVLILAYNNALVSEIRRLLRLLAIDTTSYERRIRVETLHSYIGGLLTASEALSLPEDEFLSSYDDWLSAKSDIVDAITNEDINTVIESNLIRFDWDYIIIDEAHDCHSREFEILKKFYTSQRIILADGVDRVTRRSKPIDWKAHVSTRKIKFERLSFSTRIKSNITFFLRDFASYINFPEWNVSPDLNTPGGRIIIFQGNYFLDQERHKLLLAEQNSAGNSPIDMLMIVPPYYSTSNQQPSKEQITASSQLQKWGHQVWDGTAINTRRHYPWGNEQIRLLQYDSARGLEAWTAVLLGFDDFATNRANIFKYNPEWDGPDETNARLKFIAKWLMVPLTRAIDTLVIEVRSPSHPVTRALRRVANDYPKIVEWYEPKISPPS